MTCYFNKGQLSVLSASSSPVPGGTAHRAVNPPLSPRPEQHTHIFAHSDPALRVPYRSGTEKRVEPRKGKHDPQTRLRCTAKIMARKWTQWKRIQDRRPCLFWVRGSRAGKSGQAVTRRWWKEEAVKKRDSK